MPASRRSARKLTEPMQLYRIGDPNGLFPIYSAEGARRVEGRWHEKGQEVIYASSSYSTAMLEKLAHFNGILPSGQHYIEIKVPTGVTYEVVTKDSAPGWIDAAQARAIGSRWYRERRSCLLIVPSFVARMETNVVINARHPDATAIRSGLEHPVVWDRRLFEG